MDAEARASRAPGERAWRTHAVGALAGVLAWLLGSAPVGRAAAQDASASEHGERAAAAVTPGVAARVADAESDVREGEVDLVRQARAAVDEAAARRGRGDERGAARAERIAEAALALVFARRGRIEAGAALGAARARRAEVEARLAAARTSSTSAARERERLGGADAP